MFQANVLKKIKTPYMLRKSKKNIAFYEIIWKNKVEPEALQMTISYGTC